MSVAGVDEAKEELEEIVKFLRSPAQVRVAGRARARRGRCSSARREPARRCSHARSPAKPACRSSLPARRNSSRSSSASGASRVRKLFEQAKTKAPAIVFIDELDAIGKSRSGSHGGGGTDEREQTLNQLLVEMDGFDSRDGIIVLGGDQPRRDPRHRAAAPRTVRSSGARGSSRRHRAATRFSRCTHAR